MKVLCLFDGMSCGRIALERAGLPVTTYFASELDKHAIAVARKNYPSTVQMGDVRVVREMAEAGFFGRIDLLIGGSPCQGFSFSGKQLAFDDPRSVLFFEFVRILRALQKDNPNIKFLLENVKMKKEHLDVITNFMGVAPVLINSALVSAQNRQRYYWANWKIEQPADRGILLKDIVSDENVLTDMTRRMKKIKGKQALIKAFKKNVRTINEKHKTLLASANRPATSGGCNIKIENRWFMLNSLGLERLQTVPDNYTAGVSDSQRHKMLGNGWTVDVIAHIFAGLKA